MKNLKKILERKILDKKFLNTNLNANSNHKIINFKIFMAITILLIFFSLILIFYSLDKNTKFNFKNLESLNKYANFYPENYSIDNDDWQDPNFKKFYKKTLNQSIFKKILIATKIKNEPLFNIQDFSTLLDKLAADRKNYLKPLIKNNIGKRNKNIKNLDKTIDLKNGYRCFVFGDLHASFHSFVRDLNELEKQKIIDKNLKIISPDCYIVFLGDVINRSPYSLETLNAVLLLLEKNPEKVIYLRGNHETRKYWRNFNARRQIQEIFPKYANLKSKNNIFDKIDKIFRTLPKNLILNITGPEKDSILLTFEENRDFIEGKPNIKFMLVGEKKLNNNKKKSGLEFIDYDHGITKWSLASCPNKTYQKFFSLMHDSFVEIFIAPTTRQSILTFNYHDINSPEFKQIFYAPISGKILNSKNNMSSRKTYNIGSSMYLSGITALIGYENKIGLETALYFNNFNPKNYLIKPFIFDDEYLQNLAALNIKNLINIYNIKTIIYPTGTPTIMAYIDLIKNGQVSVFFPYSGGNQIRASELKNIINFRPSFKNEIISMINYLVKDFNLKKFAFFYTDDSYGIPITEDAHNELKKLGITEWLDLPHARGNPNLDNKMINKIKEFMPEAIACISVEAIIKELIEKLSPEFFSNTILFSLSAMNGQSFERFLKTKGIKQILSSVVPDPFNSEIEIVKEFRKNMSARGLTVSFNALEAYIAGTLLSLAINKIEYPATKEKIMSFFENMNHYKYKGLELTFNPEKRDLSQPVWIRNLDNKWVKY